MASRRQERAVTIALGDGRLVLEGLFVAGASETAGGAVIAPPHPLYGGSLESPVVNEIAYAFWKAGIASLRFNWRGAGASTGEPSGEAVDADADYRAALAHLEETVSGPIAACGYSFGAAAALRVARTHPRADRLVLVSPPPPLLDRDALASRTGPVLVITGGADAIASAAELEVITASTPGAELVVVPEADHFFVTGLAEISRATFEWLRRDAG